MGIFDSTYGLLYTGDTKQMGVQLVGAAAYVGWSGLLSIMFFYSLKRNERLRVDVLFETAGLDLLPNKMGEWIDTLTLRKIQREM